ncbi:MAG: hypothetical protein PHX91_08855, partial [Prevotella sp.]|nr:hypothetical protein [Prevotella sp.]
ATRTKSFRLGGLTFEKTTPKVLSYGASGRDFYALWSFTGQQYNGINLYTLLKPYGSAITLLSSLRK